MQTECHFRQTSGSVERPAREINEPWWILSRAHYRVRSVSFANVPPKQRAAAIRLELLGWTPFARTAHHVLPQADDDAHVLLLAWDQDAVLAAQLAAGVEEASLPVVPEHALRPVTPVADGVVLHACLDGVEAVVGANGLIKTCQWWPQEPDDLAWKNFLRSASLTANIARPVPLPLNLFDRIRGTLGSQAGAPDYRKEAGIVVAGVALLLLASVWVVNDYRLLNQALKAAQTRADDTEKELSAQLAARGQALDTLKKVKRYDQLFNPMAPLALFAEMGLRLQGVAKPGTLQLTEWDWRADSKDLNSRRLKAVMVVKGDAPSATALVKALESTAAFRDVQVSYEGTKLVIEMRVEHGVAINTLVPAPGEKGVAIDPFKGPPGAQGIRP